ncbi:MAG: MFS transporter [Planctomycetota bacterium]|jgi:MFS family permease
MLRLMRYCVAGMLCDWILYTVFLTVIFLAVEKFGALEATVGLLSGVTPAAYAAMCLVGGPLADRFPRPWLVRFGAGLLGATCIAIVHAGSLAALFVFMPVLGIAGSFFWPSVQASIGAESTGEDLERNIGLFNILWSVGKGLGFLTAGVLYARLGPEATLYICAAGYAAIIVFYPWKEPAEILKEKRRLRTEERPERVPFLRMGWIANFVTFGVGAVLAAHLYKFLLDPPRGEWIAGIARSLGIAPEEPTQLLTGIVLATLYVTQTLTFIVMRQWRGWMYRRGRMYAVLFAMGIAATLFALPLPEPALIIMALAVGAGLGYGYAVSIYYSLHTPEAHGKYSGIHEAFLGASSFLAPIAAGVLATGCKEPRMSWWLCGAMVVGGVLLQEIIFRRWRARSPAPAGDR